MVKGNKTPFLKKREVGFFILRKLKSKKSSKHETRGIA
jgi:hypothetical protein